MRRAVSFFIILFMILSLAGCDSLQRKFTRKKKEAVKMPRIYQEKKYIKKPSPELYKKHYSYWTSWQSELIQVLGNNHKKDMRCIDEAVSNLRDMQSILVPKKAEELQPHIDKLARVRETIFNEELTQANRDYVLRTLEREDRYIKREFHYNKVKKYLREHFDDEG